MQRTQLQCRSQCIWRSRKRNRSLVLVLFSLKAINCKETCGWLWNRCTGCLKCSKSKAVACGRRWVYYANCTYCVCLLCGVDIMTVFDRKRSSLNLNPDRLGWIIVFFCCRQGTPRYLFQHSTMSIFHKKLAFGGTLYRMIYGKMHVTKKIKNMKLHCSFHQCYIVSNFHYKTWSIISNSFYPSILIHKIWYSQSYEIRSHY